MHGGGARRALLAGLTTTLVAAAAACSLPSTTPDCGAPAAGEQVVVLVSGTAHEPLPALPATVLELMRAAADAPADDGKGARGSVAVVASADGAVPESLPLTPRRATCAVEHGLQRAQLVDQNLDAVARAVADRAARRPGLDLLAAIDDAVRGRPPGVLVVLSSGLSTDGGFDLRSVGWAADPRQIVAQLDARGLLQGVLAGWRTEFVGLGQTAGPQPPLTKPARDTLERYWTAICGAAAEPGGTCVVDRAPLPAQPPVAMMAGALVDVPGVTSAVGPDGHMTTTVSGAVLFAGDSAELTDDARALLDGLAGQVAAAVARQPGLPVVVRGFVADPPGSTVEGRLATATARAAAVAGRLAPALEGVGAVIDAAGVGTPPGTTAVIDGTFVEAVAARMRTVTITY